jgi:hypothetical protein
MRISARVWFDRALKIDDWLAVADPGKVPAHAENLDFHFQGDRSIAHFRIAVLAKAEDDLTSAQHHFGNAMQIIQDAFAASDFEELL